MNEVVFLGSLRITEEPFTTSAVIADYAEIEHRAVRQLIRKHEEDLKEFGKTTFQMSKITKGKGRKTKIYHLNEQQATLIITYLDNTAPVRAFKKELVKQFYAMKQEQFERRLQRQQGKETRLSLTDTIKQAGISEKYYFHYTNLAYKSAIGYTTKQLRKAREVKKSQSLLDYLTTKELTAINQREQQIATLLQLGMNYEQIKSALALGGVIYHTTLNVKEKAGV